MLRNHSGDNCVFLFQTEQVLLKGVPAPSGSAGGGQPARGALAETPRFPHTSALLTADETMPVYGR